MTGVANACGLVSVVPTSIGAHIVFTGPLCHSDDPLRRRLIELGLYLVSLVPRWAAGWLH